MAMVLAVPGFSVGQSAVQAPNAKGAPTPQPSDVAQELRTLERKWVVALTKPDVKLLGEILDNSYMDTDEEGHQTDKNGLLAALKSGDLKLTGIQLSAMKIHSYIYAAVVTGHALQSGTFKGEKIASTVVFTDTFILMDGVWKVVASHRSAPPTEK